MRFRSGLPAESVGQLAKSTSIPSDPLRSSMARRVTPPVYWTQPQHVSTQARTAPSNLRPRATTTATQMFLQQAPPLDSIVTPPKILSYTAVDRPEWNTASAAATQHNNVYSNATEAPSSSLLHLQQNLVHSPSLPARTLPPSPPLSHRIQEASPGASTTTDGDDASSEKSNYDPQEEEEASLLTAHAVTRSRLPLSHRGGRRATVAAVEPQLQRSLPELDMQRQPQLVQRYIQQASFASTTDGDAHEESSHDIQEEAALLTAKAVTTRSVHRNAAPPITMTARRRLSVSRRGRRAAGPGRIVAVLVESPPPAQRQPQLHRFVQHDVPSLLLASSSSSSSSPSYTGSGERKQSFVLFTGRPTATLGPIHRRQQETFLKFLGAFEK